FCLHCNTHHQGACPNKERRRGSAHQRGYTLEWQRLARAAIAAHPYCSRCPATTDLTADHITPLSKGGKNVLQNIQVLCRSCNSSKGGRGGRSTTENGFER